MKQLDCVRRILPRKLMQIPSKSQPLSHHKGHLLVLFRVWDIIVMRELLVPPICNSEY